MRSYGVTNLREFRDVSLIVMPMTRTFLNNFTNLVIFLNIKNHGNKKEENLRPESF